MAEALGPIASIGGALLNANGAQDAANTQAGAVRDANGNLIASQAANVNRLSPFVTNGQAANNTLAYYLGIGGSNPNASPTSLSAQWSNLVGSDGNGPPTPNAQLYASNPAYKAAFDNAYAQIRSAGGGWDNTTPTSEVNSFIQQQLAPQYQQEMAASGGNSSDPVYGSLLKQYTGQDLLNQDPGYQFRLDQGNKQINAAAAAAGRYDSGAALKSLDQYTQNYASNEYQNAFTRDQTNKNTTYNFLSGQSNAGENAAAGVGVQGNQVANQTGQNTIGAGNAAAASDLASSNQYANALNSMASGYAKYNQTSSSNPYGSTGGVNSAGYNALGTYGTIGGTATNPMWG